MCDDHKHLGGKITKTYSDTNFVMELDQVDSAKKKLEDKRGKIVEKLKNEISDLLLSNNNFREVIGKPLSEEILDLTEKSEQELLSILSILREENNSLVQDLITKENEERKAKIIQDKITTTPKNTIIEDDNKPTENLETNKIKKKKRSFKNFFKF